MPRLQCYLLISLGCLWAQLVTSKPDAASLDGPEATNLIEVSELTRSSPLEQDASRRAQKAAKVVLAKIVDDAVRKAKVAAGVEAAKVTPACVDKEPAYCKKTGVSPEQACTTDTQRIKCAKSCRRCPPKGYSESKSEYARVSKVGLKAEELFDKEFNKHLYGDAASEKVREATFARAMASRTKRMASFAAQEVALATAKVKKWKAKAADKGTFAEANMATQALKTLSESKARYEELAARSKELDSKAAAKDTTHVHLKVAVLLQGCRGESDTCPHGEVYWGEIAAMRKAVAEINQQGGMESMPGVDGVKMPRGYKIQLVEQLFADMEELLQVSQNLARDSTVLAVIAPGSSLFTTAVVPIFRLYSKAVIGWGAHSTQLSNNILYPNFKRMTHTTATPYIAVTEILKHYDWNRVGVIMNLDGGLDDAYRQFKARADDSGIKVVATALDVPTSVECNAQQLVAKMRYMAATKPKAIVLWPYYRTTSEKKGSNCLDEVVSAAASAGLFNKDVTWVLTDDAYDQVNDESKAQLQGALWLKMTMAKAASIWRREKMNKVCDEGARELFAVGEGQSTSGRCCRGKPGNEVCRTTGRRTVLAYDSIYATGHAIVNAINTGAASPESVLEVFNGVKFEGLSGAVMFDSKGERLVQYDINNLRDQASSVKYVRVGVYDPIQFEGQRLEIPDENEVVLHYEPESATAGPCWVGGDHPFRNQACKTCVRRTESKGAAGDRNSCTSCFPGSSVYPVVAGSKIGECRAAAPPFTCTSGEITQDEQAGPAMCTDRSKCRKCRGQCMGFPKESALANSLASVREGSSAPTFCPPFWQSYGSAFNFHTTEECLPKVSARLDEPGAVVTCTKMTTTWSPRYFPRNGVAPVMNDYEPVASPEIDSLGMFYTSPHNQNQYIHTELLQEAESTLDDAHVVVMDEKTAVPKQPLQAESALPVSVPSPPMLPALRPRASAEHVLTASACQCSKRVECIQGACNSRKRCTCAETCFLTTGPNAHKDDKCKGGVLRTSLTVGLAQMAVSDLQAGDYCCYIECKVPENAPQFMRMMAKANAFCDVALTAL